MVVREQGDIQGIGGVNVQENGVTQLSTGTLNITGGGTVTDTGGVATINIPYGCTWYREDVSSGSATYTFVHSPASSTSFLVFTDSGTLMYSGIDYTYNSSTETITFLTLESNEAAYIWIAHASVTGGNVGDMTKAVYDPTNINASAFDYNNFINKPVIPAAQIQSDWNQSDNTKLDYIKNKPTIPSISGLVTGAASSTDGNIVIFDGVTGKVIKDSGLNIQIVNSQPTGLACTVFYDNGTIYLYTHQPSEILMENGNVITTEDGNPIILEN